jgi:hypothetical protein
MEQPPCALRIVPKGTSLKGELYFMPNGQAPWPQSKRASWTTFWSRGPRRVKSALRFPEPETLSKVWHLDTLIRKCGILRLSRPDSRPMLPAHTHLSSPSTPFQAPHIRRDPDITADRAPYFTSDVFSSGWWCTFLSGSKNTLEGVFLNLVEPVSWPPTTCHRL